MILRISIVRVQSRLQVMEDRFQDAIELPVMLAVQHGFVEHYKRSYLNVLVQEFGNFEDPSNSDITYAPGTIADLYFMFSCVAIGVSMSCITFAGELLFNKYNS